MTSLTSRPTQTRGREVAYPPENRASRPVPLASPSAPLFMKRQITSLARQLKWPVSELWIDTITEYLAALMPQIQWPLSIGDVYRTKFGEVRVVSELEHEGCPVFGKALRDVLPYKITVAARAGRHRAELALVHELLHATDYRVGVPLDHTLLHNIAAIIESEVLQKMRGYDAT